MRVLALMFLLALCLSLGASDSGQRDILGLEARITATPVLLDSHDPARIKVGALTYLGGVRLRSPDLAFGGFSAMQVVGDRFLLVSDAGNIVRFRMDAAFRISEASFGDVRIGPGTGQYKPERDIESLTSDPATGRIWLGYERENAIWRYDATLLRSARAVRPAAMRGWSTNGGPESMVRLRDGRFIVISETSRPKGPLARTGREALMFAGDPTEAPDRGFGFVYVPPAGFDPSDMTELPDGRLLILNRRFAVPSLFTARITLVDPGAIRPGAAVQGREIAAFASPLLHDNFEALAVTREGKDTILWMASDDNQQFWEQSLLLKFRVEL
ncbi:MAG: esterase-like activity of phytase family protein [Sphingomonas sp.]|uniref:esterase-like activity of phytase family protein n=1 Tax=Sphingomonas sp. TaxID=28214 RepID=UPI0025D898C0|nr:esterase-like activity of phytase family protein [Sphingomonas sp.]MBX3563292.1 esterase-like activity of phytase family protein [Sphingomonas sp.]